jgi:hypothetical protein
MPPKLVFVGDGPARVELAAICQKEGHDAVFMGHRSGTELAACYASADVFAFPSFTETFGQVVLEALASGLPVVGLDAEGTRDLVSHARTGLLLPLPHKAVTGENPSRTWPTICRDHSTEIFAECAEGYASLLGQAVLDHEARRGMGTTASTEGIVGYTWWDAMEVSRPMRTSSSLSPADIVFQRCVDGYRESIRQARQGKSISVVVQQPDEAPVAPVTSMSPGSPGSRISRVNRALSRRLAKGKWPEHERNEEVVRRGLLRRVKGDTSESVWHLSECLSRPRTDNDGDVVSLGASADATQRRSSKPCSSSQCSTPSGRTTSQARLATCPSPRQRMLSWRKSGVHLLGAECRAERSEGGEGCCTVIMLGARPGSALSCLAVKWLWWSHIPVRLWGVPAGCACRALPTIA